MKKQITSLLPILLLVLPFTAKSQGVIGGLAGGLSMGAVEIKNVDDRFVDGLHGDYVFGFEAGIFGRLSLGPFYVRPQLMYQFQRGDVSYRLDGDQSSKTSAYASHRILIPVPIGLHLLGPLAIEAGPTYNYMLAHTSRFDGEEVQIGKSGVGYRVGPALDFESAVIYASYEGLVSQSRVSDGAKFREPYRIVFGVAFGL